MALFGYTAKLWREANSGKNGNIRDFASIQQLVVLSNLESINAMLIQQEMTQKDRLMKLNQIAIKQMKSLVNYNQIQNLIDEQKTLKH